MTAQTSHSGENRLTLSYTHGHTHTHTEASKSSGSHNNSRQTCSAQGRLPWIWEGRSEENHKSRRSSISLWLCRTGHVQLVFIAHVLVFTPDTSQALGLSSLESLNTVPPQLFQGFGLCQSVWGQDLASLGTHKTLDFSRWGPHRGVWGGEKEVAG